MFQAIYKIRLVILCKRVINKILKMDVAQRRKHLLKNGFIMISYDESNGTQTRVYRHKCGVKVTDKVTKVIAP